MDHFLSAEIRWFYKREKANDRRLHEWFHSLGKLPAKEPATRTDYYYRLANSPYFGIKLRMEAGGKSETKERIRDYGPVQYHDRLVGRVNDWSKWSFALNEPIVEYVKLREAWLAVEKKRWLLQYRVERSAGDELEISPLVGNERVEAGFGLELTEVRAEGQKWLTIGFEAFDARGEQRRVLDAGIRFVCDQCEPPLLLAEDSKSYYRWLDDQFFS